MASFYICDDNNGSKNTGNIFPITPTMQTFINDLINNHVTVTPENITSKYWYNGKINDPYLKQILIKHGTPIKCSFRIWCGGEEWMLYNDA